MQFNSAVDGGDLILVISQNAIALQAQRVSLILLCVYPVTQHQQ